MCCLATGLRFAASKKTTGKVNLESWLALASLVFFLVYTLMFLYRESHLIHHATGLSEYFQADFPLPDSPDSAERPKPDRACDGSSGDNCSRVESGFPIFFSKRISHLPSLQVGWAMSPQFCPNQLLTKLTLLLFYHRIFWINKRFVRWLWCIGILTVLWTVSVYLVKWMLCWPVAYTWNKTLSGGKCIEIPAFLAASETINSVIDFVMIAMAIRIVATLQMSFIEKFRLSILFSVGSLYVYTHAPNKVRETNVTAGLVSLVSSRLPRPIQLHVSIIPVPILNPVQATGDIAAVNLRKRTC